MHADPEEYLEPTLESWPARQVLLRNPDLQQLRRSARRRLVESAEQWTSRLSDDSRISGLNSSKGPLLTGDSQTVPIVMTGHQPVVFHTGIVFKYEVTESFASERGLIAIAVVIDTDEGDAGSFSFPSARSVGTTATLRVSQQLQETSSHRHVAQPALSELSTETASFGMGTSLFGSCRIKPPEELRAVAARVSDSLINLGCRSEAGYLQRISEDYARLESQSMMEANLIVRRNAGIGNRMLEVPLSVICEFPEVREVFREILARPIEFAQCANDTLNTFRAQHRIRNEANPFPNLQITPDECELPFWIVDHAAGTRTALKVRRDRNTELESFGEGGKQLIPRRALITAFLRLLFSDVFVHGTGGGNYDQYTSELILAWWHVDPSPIVVASASRYLFESERAELRKLHEISGMLRGLQFNPQRHFGTGAFSATLECTLMALIQQKDEAVRRMKHARESRLPAREPGHEIQVLGDSIKSLVSGELGSRLEQLKKLSPENIATLNNRKWPWFLFARK